MLLRIRPRFKYIYGLRKLNTKTYVYIGQSFEPEKRLTKHIKDAKARRHNNKELAKWIVDTLKESLIIMDIIEKCNEQHANNIESFYIKKYKSAKLLNLSDPLRPYKKL